MSSQYLMMLSAWIQELIFKSDLKLERDASDPIQSNKSFINRTLVSFQMLRNIPSWQRQWSNHVRFGSSASTSFNEFRSTPRLSTSRQAPRQAPHRSAPPSMGSCPVPKLAAKRRSYSAPALSRRVTRPATPKAPASIIPPVRGTPCVS